jgi:spore germination cell wall hydrolase CwlJ-like protein
MKMSDKQYRIIACVLWVIFISWVVLSSLKAHADDFHSFNRTPPQTGVECLAEAVYFEGAIDGELGMYLVANVIANRVSDRALEFRNLNTWCEVVHQPARDPNRPWECAFSYYCDGEPEVVPDIKSERLAFIAAFNIAYEFINNSTYVLDLTDGALYYTQSQVSRGWMNNTTITVTYLHHTFRKPTNNTKGEYYDK